MAIPGTFYSIYDIKDWRNPTANPPFPQKKISIKKKKKLSHEQEKFLIQ